ncbi:antitoxin Xre-like helix-turn-helix domain-containing protein [uncultured Polaribacter sp.]|uniref:type II RES/Xre toxin-antitoxin system antitoxin n=1 Tax=uncultured Polaribacter sp. TaxID=174711 RepID=UPI00261E0034|nr:antitoxin Xre-like helix-turn-helix domain-containing protein [uncultured Polaribacter sp.]
MEDYKISKSDKKPINQGLIISKILFPEQVSNVEESSKIYALANDTSRAFPKILDDDKNFYQLIHATRKGLPYKSLLNAQVLMPFSIQEWATILHISVRSIDRLKKERKKLNISQSEKLIEITLLYDYGVDVFGAADKFSKWLERANIGLGGVAPKSLLDTNQGMKAIKSQLSRIEYGVLA